jgi:hypothetical protein
MSINHLYHSWVEQLVQLRPKERITRIRNLAWLVIGIYQSRSVHLSAIAQEIPSQAKLLSVVQRLERFLNNPALQVRSWYEPMARSWLQSAAASGEIRLIVDGSKVGFGHQLLMIAVAYRRRSIPIVWTWIKGARGHSSARTQLALLAYVQSLLPPDSAVLVVGDSEFGAIEILRYLAGLGWHYALRQKANNQVQRSESSSWQNFGALVQEPGQTVWLPGGLLTRKHTYHVNLVAHWKLGEAEPWLLATNLTGCRLTLLAYKRRMWIEEMFGDFKGHGFDLESTHLRHFMRLARLTLAVALLYIWLVTTGATVIKNGQRHFVDRADRRDLCIFQIGLRWIKRRLINSLPVRIKLWPSAPIIKVSGG